MRLDHSIFLLAGLFAAVPGIVEAETKVQTQIGGTTGSTCVKFSKDKLLAGSIGNIAVIVFPDAITEDPPFSGHPLQQPAWLSLEFGYAINDDDPFVASPELYGLLNPTYYVSGEQLGANASLASGEMPTMSISQRTYFFKFNVPLSLAGEWIQVRAVLNSPPYGPVHFDNGSGIRRTDRKQIIATCSKDDEDRVLASYVFAADDLGDSQRVLQLADSLLDTGWRSKRGLLVARTAAHKLGKYESALRYLDTMYETYGIVYPHQDPSWGSIESQYHSHRASLVKAIAEQERRQK